LPFALGVRSGEIDLLICCNISRCDGPNYRFSFEPATAVRLRQRLGLSRAWAFDVSNACAGMFTGITVADALLKAGAVRRALVVSGSTLPICCALRRASTASWTHASPA
jgi:3-oxoacyl-[acyl-carrier-protein] synthase III